MDPKTEADLQAEFEERNGNLKQSMADVFRSDGEITSTGIQSERQSNTEMQAEYDTRHENLKKSFNELWNSIEQKARHAGSSSWQELDKQQQQVQKVEEREQQHEELGPTFPQSAAPALSDDPLFALSYKINKSAMDATRRDISAMHELDAEKFETVAAKMEDMFGNNALTEQGPDMSLYRHGV
ncbi:hypothetical protein DFQ30_000013 [Apophysomyces sp. BC1015]|nr:hypothetical protein DFQ30_000013 [Apophysomyces sp. BC1015]